LRSPRRLRHSLLAKWGLLAFAFALLVAIGWAAPASAGTWTAFSLKDDQVGGGLFGVSCPSTTLCVAGGSDSLIATSTNPAAGPNAWAIVHPGGKEEIPGGSGGEVAFPGAQVRGISCPSTTLCVGATFDGRIFSSTAPTGGLAAWKVTPLTGEKEPRFHMTGISCPSPRLCVAVAYGSKVIISADPTGDASTWVVSQLAFQVDLRGVSCPSVSFCVAVDNAGRIAASSNPTGGAGAWSLIGAPAGEGVLNGISCPSLSLCVTGNDGQMITSIDPGGGLGAWHAITAGTGLPVEAVSCPTTSACAAVDNNADAIVSTNPLGGSAEWSSTNVLPAPQTEKNSLGGVQNGMFGISCPATTLCVGVGASENVIASTNPFTPDATLVSLRKSKRLRVVITKHPLQRIDPRKGGARVGFRFHSVGEHATRFRCKLGGGELASTRTHLRRLRFTACASSVTYRLGKGKYVFRVLAVAAGRKSPPASFSFRVGRLVEGKPPGSCPATPQRFSFHPCFNAR